MAKTIKGTKGNDRIDQNGRPELEIRALGGNDTIVLDRDDDLGGDNFVDAGGGKDTVFSAFEGGNTILLGKGNDTYVGTGFSSLGGSDGVDGGGGNDQFFLKTLKSAYHGGNGQDIFHSDGWQNNINGGKGEDTISYQFRHEDSVAGDSGVTIDLLAGAAQTGASRFETLTSIENAIGSELSDVIGGTNEDNVLTGLGGADTLIGGGGADVFVYNRIQDSRAIQGSLDLIADFSSADGDRIDLRGLAGNTTLSFSDADFFSNRRGEIVFVDGGVFVDMNGDGAADMAIDMNGLGAMSRSDFIL